MSKFKSVLVGFIVALCVLSSSVKAAVVLVYHHVSDATPPSTSVSLPTFIEHLDLIEELGLTPISVEKLVETILSGQPVDNNWVVLTFDDGYSSVYDNALPELKKRDWPFAVFVNPDMVKPSKLYMDWPELKTLTQHKGTIVNHTLKHENLHQDGLNLDEIKHTVMQSQLDIKQKLGHDFKILAYPYGEYNDEVKALLKSMDYAAFAQHSGAINETSDLQALMRFPANGIYANPKTLKNKLKALPFNLKTINPRDTIPTNEKPEVTVALASRDFYQSQLACFITGEKEPVKPEWLDDLTFKLNSKEAIGKGRIKYNCTAPSIKHSGRFYWMSKLWINN